MTYHYDFKSILEASARVDWQVEDIIGGDRKLDFGNHFMPEGLARTAGLDQLTELERRTLNQIRGHEYLSIFGLVEEFILPFVLDHARPQLSGDDHRVRALLQFAGEEAKHIHLFKTFRKEFRKGAGYGCDVIGPPEAVAAEVLRHDSLAVALVILHIEWMTQRHYLEDVRGDEEIDPLFSSLLRHHWMEEAQHAKLDTMMVEALADGREEGSIQAALDEYLEIGLFLDQGLKHQAEFNLLALEKATGWRPLPGERQALLEQQHQAARWCYLGSGMTHPKFRETLGRISEQALARIDEVAPAFC
jgi:hypothetical protein